MARERDGTFRSVLELNIKFPPRRKGRDKGGATA
jgi:hypothetical protein